MAAPLVRALPVTLSCLAAALGAGCDSNNVAAAQASRLQPTDVRLAGLGGPARLLVDLDTESGVPLTSRSTVTFSLARDYNVTEVKVFAQGELTMGVGGQSVDAASDRWVSLVLDAPRSSRAIEVTLTPRGTGTVVRELEVWGSGHRSAPIDLAQLAPLTRPDETVAFDNVVTARSAERDLTLTPAGLATGTPCVSTRLRLPTEFSAVALRRAFLAYEAVGVQRSIVLRRSIDGREAIGGLWLGGGSRERTVVDELDPKVIGVESGVTLCLPAEATSVVVLRDLRLVGVLEDGRYPLDREAQAFLGEGADGLAQTHKTLGAGAHFVGFDRAIQVEKSELSVTSTAGALTARALAVDGWKAVEVLEGTPKRGLVVGDAPIQALELSAPGGTRSGIPAVVVDEITVVGSPVGRRIARAKLVLTYPATAVRNGRWAAEHFGRSAYVAGWAESPSGPGVVEVDGITVGGSAGDFGTVLTRPPGDAPWVVTVSARFPDGTTEKRVIELDDDREAEVLAEQALETTVSGENARYGSEEETAWGRINRSMGGRVQLGTDVLFDAPPGAVDSDLSVGITRKSRESVPTLDPGMINVTAPAGAAYRFHPPGQVFKANVKVTVPYDAALLPKGVPDEQVRTYFYDRKLRRWYPLARKAVRRDRRQVESETMHFTFMVNAVLATPDHPGPASFNPNSLKDIAVADPMSNIDLVDAPSGNSLGTAQVGFPFRLPTGRGAHQPQVGLRYDSSAGNGWVGVGWDVSVPLISVDTKFGAPFFDGNERYVYGGAQLVPVEVAGLKCLDGSDAVQFHTRVEGAFDRIYRCGASVGNYHFEVTDKQGTLHVFGATDDARLRDGPSGPIGQWLLQRVVDAHGNLTTYQYAEDSLADPDAESLGGHGEPFTYKYLRTIAYTGTAARLGAVAITGTDSDELGSFTVDFLNETSTTDPSKRANRGDPIISGRLGFKTVLRHRLHAVRITMDAGETDRVVREYRLSYEEGDLGKSLLSGVEVFGEKGIAGGPLFFAHSFHYTRKAGDGGLGEIAHFPVAKPEESVWDSAAVGHTMSRSRSLGAYLGVGLGWSKSSGSVGINFTYGQSLGETKAALVDVNGDGRPDRLWDGGRVAYNRGPNLTMSPAAPPGDPQKGDLGLDLEDFGTDSSDSYDLTIEGNIGGLSLSVGNTWGFARSDSALLDVNADGFVDYLSANGVLFQQPRTAPGADTDQISFAGTLPLSPASKVAELIAADPEATRSREAVAKMIRPVSPVIEWTAPYSGKVDVTGALKFVHPPAAGTDGVELTVYHNSTPLEPSWSKLAGDETSTPVGHTVDVVAGDKLFFLLSSKTDVPIHIEGNGDARRPVGAEAIQFAPRVVYTECAGLCGGIWPGEEALTDATGAPLFSFDLAKDFRLAGYPPQAAQMAMSGTVEFGGQLAKKPTSDDVRLCIRRYSAKTLPAADERCVAPAGDVPPPDQPYFRALRSAEASEEQQAPIRIEVQRGDVLLFLVDSDLAIDPAAVNWQLDGRFASLGTGEAARPPTEDEAKDLVFFADPMVRLHGSTQEAPLRPFTAPRGGVLRIWSKAERSDGFEGQMYFSVRTPRGLILKHALDESRYSDVEVTAGQPLWFEAHGENHPCSDGNGCAAVPGWQLNVWYPDEVATGDQPQYLDVLTAVTFDSGPNGPGYVSPAASPLGGGYHRFRFGTWQGRPGVDTEAFDASLFTPLRREDISDWAEGTDEERLKKARAHFRREDSPARRRAELIGTLLPRRRGTASPKEPGMHPAAAFVSGDELVWVGADGSMHAARRGLRASSRDVASVDLTLGNGASLRESTSSTFHGGLSAGIPGVSLSVGLAAGTSHQKIDLIDVNADGVPDLVYSNDGRTSTATLTKAFAAELPKQEVPVPRSARRQVELTFNAGMGIAPVPDHRPNTFLEAVSQPQPGVGLGVSATTATTEATLMDVNGDGLPDSVRFDGTALKVRLNYGTRFAASEDTLSLDGWGDTQQKEITAIVGGVLGEKWAKEPLPGEEGADPEEDPDRAQSRVEIAGALPLLTGKQAIRRNNTFTVQANAGFSAEGNGVGISVDTSFTETPVALIDVTGDGLPDYVRKARGESDMQVMVNTGYGFAAPKTWELESWLGELLPGFVQPADARFQGLGFVEEAADKLRNELIPDLFTTAVDAVEASGSHTLVPKVAVSTFIPIWAWAVWIHIGASESISTEQVSGFELGFTDMDGDGFADHVLKSHKAFTNHEVLARMNQLSGGNLLERVELARPDLEPDDHPKGGSIHLSYARQEGTVAVPQVRWVLKDVEVKSGYLSGAGRDFVTSYEYGDGSYDRAEREFYGYGTVVQTNPDASRLIRTFDQSSYHTRGFMKAEVLEDADGNVHRVFEQIPAASSVVSADATGCLERAPLFVDSASYCAAIFTPVERTVRRSYAVDGDPAPDAFVDTSERLSYDVYGNVIRYEDYGQDGDEADPDDYHAEVLYEAADDAALKLHAVSRPKHVWVRSGPYSLNAPLLRERSAIYKGVDVETLSERINDVSLTTSTLTWNANGTLKSFTGPQPGEEGDSPYTVTYEQYDGVVGIYPEKVTDAFEYTSEATYDPAFGVQTTAKDIGGSTTAWNYDSHGRLSSVHHPASGPALLSFWYEPHGDPLRWARTTHRMPRSLSEGSDHVVNTVVYADTLGRSIQTRKDAEVWNNDTGMTWSGVVSFDSMGRVTRQGQPCFGVAGAAFEECVETYPTVTTYDVLGRVTSVQVPGTDGPDKPRNTSFAYGFAKPAGDSVTRARTTTTDPLGNMRVNHQDMKGRLVAVEEHLLGSVLTTRYDYSALGELERVIDAQGNVIASEYDMLGRRTSLTSKDTGTTSYTFDPAGNMRFKRTANLTGSNRIEYRYTFGRLDEIIYPSSPPVTLSYGTAGFNKGRLTTIVDEAGKEEREYGSLGEVIRSTRTVRPTRPGDEELRFTTSFKWDAFGRMMQLTYPDGEDLFYTYDAGGLLAKVVGSRPATSLRPAETEVYVETLKYDLFGQRAYLKLGNQVDTTYTYEPATRRLHTLTTVTGDKRKIQAITYRYDAVDNIRGVANALGPATHTQAGGVTYTYGYDALYRLTSAVGRAEARPGVIDRFESTFAYSGIHNMTRNAQVRELRRALPGETPAERPEHSNHDWSYQYEGGRPHQATRIGDTLLAYDAAGNTIAECSAKVGEVCAGLPETDSSVPVSHDHLRRYHWNEENRLKSVVEGGTGTATRFLYDYSGERVVKAGSSGTSISVGQFYSVKGRVFATKHVFAGGTRVVSKLQPIAPNEGPPSDDEGEDVDPPGLIDNENGCEPSGGVPPKCLTPVLGGGLGAHGAYANFRPVTYYYHPDHLGSTTWLTDQYGRVQERLEYYPYGEVWREDREERNGTLRRIPQFQFTSKEFDEETGLTYFGARYYDSKFSRWLSTDPLFEEQGPIGLSVYHYANWNPIRFRDPDGRRPDTEGTGQTLPLRDLKVSDSERQLVKNAIRKAHHKAVVFYFAVDIKMADEIRNVRRIPFAELMSWEDATAEAEVAVKEAEQGPQLAIIALPGSGFAKRAAGKAVGAADDVFHVTPDGVALPKGTKHKIPEGYVENPHRSGSYGDIVDGKFKERLRIDPPTPPGQKGPNTSHYHLDGTGKHYSPAPGDKDPGFQP